MKKRKRFKKGTLGIVSIGIVMLIGCGADIPEDCGENVLEVVSIDFNGPSVLQKPPFENHYWAGYDVTITIEKEDESKVAKVCYAVRDDDPIWKGPWAVDDVLDASFLVIPIGENSRTFEGAFVLISYLDTNNICGSGALPGDLKVEGCSGEDEAEVYLQPLGSPGAESPRHKIRIE